MRSLKGNPKVIQFLQRNHPSLFLPQILLPNPAAEGTPSTLSAVGQSTIQEMDPATALNQEVLPDSNPPIPPVLLQTLQPPASTDTENIQSPAAQLESPLPDDISDNAPSTSTKRKKPKCMPDPLTRPMTRAQTRQQKTGNSNTPAEDDDLIDPQTSETSDTDTSAHPWKLYDVDCILDSTEENVCILSTLELFMCLILGLRAVRFMKSNGLGITRQLGNPRSICCMC